MKPHLQAWRFAFRPVDALERAVGPMASARGRIELVRDADAVRQAILLLVGTRPGERVMRPDYGCNLFRLAFAPNDDTTAGLAIHYVKVALDRWESRIAVLALDAQRHRVDAGRLDIHLQYRLRRLPGAEQLNLSYDLRAGRIT
jgi:phage baseplate assembly protein W